MAFTNEIGKYKLLYYGKRSNNSGSIAYIRLYNGTNQNIGSVRFYRDGQNIPDNSSVELGDPKRAFLKMHESQIDTVVDMLRNEKPCYVYYSYPKYAYIHTGAEPVGEEESEE